MFFFDDVVPPPAYTEAAGNVRVRERIAHLRANIPAPLRALLVIVGDGQCFDVPDCEVIEASGFMDARRSAGSFDGAVCVDVLDRVDDPGVFLDRLRAALEPNAPFSVTVNSVDSTAARHSRAAWRGFRSGASRFYNVDSLQSTLIAHGFRDPLIFIEGAVRQQSLRLRSAARAAAAVGLVGLAVRAQGRAAIIDESMTMICRSAEPIGRYRLSVIVPVYNEARTFRELMSRLLAKSIDGVDIDVTIVESNSNDGSREAVLEYESHPRVSVVLQEKARGKGNAVRAGLALATGDIILFQDADLEYEIDDYDDLLQPIIAHQRNFVIGSRHSNKGSAWKIRDFSGAPVMSQVFNLGHLLFLGLLNGIYGQSMADPFSMFKVFRRDCLAGLTFECNRFDFDFEIVIKLLRKGYRPLETPVNYQSRSIAEGKKVTMVRDPLTWLRALLRFRKSPLYAPLVGDRTPVTTDERPGTPVSNTAEGDYSGTELLRLAEATLRNYNDAIVDEVIGAAPTGGRILDFGAGIGTLPRGMRARGFAVDCVELDGAQRAELERDGFRCYAQIADVADASYDYIYSSNVLEHIDDDVGALRELRRVLKPGGSLLLYVPAFNVIYTINDRMIGHCRRYTIPVLRERLQRAGLTVQSSRYADFLGFFVTYIFKVVSNKMESVNPRTTGIYDSYIFPVSRLIERFVRVPVGKNVYALARRLE